MKSQRWNSFCVARGSTRIVLLIGHLAFKLPNVAEWRLFLQGLLANMQERLFARTGWPELCPVLWADPIGLLVIMRRARPLTKSEFAAINWADFCQNENYVIPAEHKIDSFGWVGDRLVAIDYGN